MKCTYLFAIITAFLITNAPVGAASREQGWFGIRYAVETEGLLSGTIKSVAISAVRPDSAAAEHVTAGDVVIEVENQAVAGSRASTLRALLCKSVGETLHLRLRSATGEIYTATLIAGRKPSG